MDNQWLSGSFILLAMLAIFAMVGNFEKLPPEAQLRLDMAERGIEYRIVVANNFGHD